MNIPASQIAAELKTFCGKHDSQKAAAKALRVTDSQLSMALSGKSNVIPGKILKKLGYVTALAYFKIGEEPNAKKKNKKPANGKVATRKKTTVGITTKAQAEKIAETNLKAAVAPKRVATTHTGRVLGMAVEHDEAFHNPEASTSSNPVIDINVRGD